MTHLNITPLSLPYTQESAESPKTPTSRDESTNTRFSFLSWSPLTPQKKHPYYHSLFGHSTKQPTNHIDLKSRMTPINTMISIEETQSSVHDGTYPRSVDGSNKSISGYTDSYIGSITRPLDNMLKGFIHHCSSTTNFRPIRPMLSFESFEYKSITSEQPEDRTLFYATDDDLCTIPSDEDLEQNDTDRSHNTFTRTDNDEHSPFVGLHPLQCPLADSEHWSINTPTTDYTRFKLYGAIAISPFNINKKSFLSLRTKATPQTAETSETTTYFPTATIPKLTVYQTIFTVVNVYVNNTILFNSYALKRGGLFAVFLFGLLCVWLCYTGTLMVHALCDRTVPSLYAYMGWCFSLLMSVVIVLENIGRTIICLVTMWQNILYIMRYDILSDADPLNEHQLQINIAMISSAVLLLPTVWMLFFSDLVFDSILGFISTWSLALIVVANFVVHSQSDTLESTEIVFWPQDISGVVLCFGIFIANMAGHSCLPTIYNQMEDPREYNYALNVSWMIIFVIEMTTGVFGYCTYGANTKLMITESMMETSVPNEPRHVLFTLLTVCLVINLFVHVPIGVAIASQLPENVLQLKHHLIRRVFRTVLFMVIVYTAWLCLDQIALLSAFIGSILTLTISMLCPLIAKVYLDLRTNKNKNVFIGIVVVSFTSFSIFMLCILFHFHAPS